MTDEQVLTKCVEIAVENGWDTTGIELARAGDTAKAAVNDPNWLIFDHDFAKALFGLKESGHKLFPEWEVERADRKGYDLCVDYAFEYPAWKHHLQQLALAEDRIDYLRKYLEEK